MGGRGSGRWHDHRKHRLVEDAIAIDLVVFRRNGALDQAHTDGTMTWNAGEAPAAAAQWRLGVVSEGRRPLDVVVALVGVEEPVVAHVELTAFEPHLGGHRWFLVCPEPGCRRRALRLYIDGQSRRVACRRCLSLTHRSAQTHDSRRDFARRDLVGFLESRAQFQSERSRLATLWTALASQDAKLAKLLAARRGRGWGTKSFTGWHRAIGEMRAEYELKWGRPVPDEMVARAGGSRPGLPGRQSNTRK